MKLNTTRVSGIRWLEWTKLLVFKLLTSYVPKFWTVLLCRKWNPVEWNHHMTQRQKKSGRKIRSFWQLQTMVNIYVFWYQILLVVTKNGANAQKQKFSPNIATFSGMQNSLWPSFWFHPLRNQVTDFAQET